MNYYSKINLVNELVLWMFFRLLYKKPWLCIFFITYANQVNVHVLSYRDPYLRLAGGRQKTLVVL